MQKLAGDMRELCEPRLCLLRHGHGTRSQLSGELIQETTFPSFVKKGAKMYNALPEAVKKGSKEQARDKIKKNYKSIKAAIDKKCVSKV